MNRPDVSTNQDLYEIVHFALVHVCGFGYDDLVVYDNGDFEFRMASKFTFSQLDALADHFGTKRIDFGSRGDDSITAHRLKVSVWASNINQG